MAQGLTVAWTHGCAGVAIPAFIIFLVTEFQALEAFLVVWQAVILEQYVKVVGCFVDGGWWSVCRILANRRNKG